MPIQVRYATYHECIPGLSKSMISNARESHRILRAGGGPDGVRLCCSWWKRFAERVSRSEEEWMVAGCFEYEMVGVVDLGFLVLNRLSICFFSTRSFQRTQKNNFWR